MADIPYRAALYCVDDVPENIIQRVRSLLKLVHNSSELTWERALPNRAHPAPCKNYTAILQVQGCVIGFMAIVDGVRCNMITLHPDVPRPPVVRALFTAAINGPRPHALQPQLRYYYKKNLPYASDDLTIAVELGFKLCEQRYAIPEFTADIYEHRCGVPEKPKLESDSLFD